MLLCKYGYLQDMVYVQCEYLQCIVCMYSVCIVCMYSVRIVWVYYEALTRAGIDARG